MVMIETASGQGGATTEITASGTAANETATRIITDEAARSGRA